MRDGYYARWRGREYEASPDGDTLRLYASEPEDGFTPIRTGRLVRVVPADQVEEFCYVRTACTWQGEPFIILGEADGWLRVEYTGGKAPVARTLGLEEFDFGVYQGWAPAADVTNVREYRT
ncbi:MAG TPA: hypothetical protein VF163_11620 [Micromonosporaceae bacterium]